MYDDESCISVGKHSPSMHCFSDSYENIFLTEKVALESLEEQSLT